MKNKTLISVFNGVNNTIEGEEKELGQIFSEIKSNKFKEPIERIRKLLGVGKDKEAQALKKNLVAFTPSGRFSERKHSKLLEYSQIVVLDFDKISGDIDIIRKKIVSDPYTLCCFLSPSGKGLKVFVNVDSPNDSHKMAFKLVDQHFFELTAQRSDPACKDLPRLCFISHDPDLYVNWDSCVFPVEIEEKKKDTLIWHGKLEQTMRFTENLIPFAQGKRNSFVHQFGSNANRFGIPQSETEAYCIEIFTEIDFTKEEILTCIGSAYSKKDEFGSYLDYKPEKTYGISVVDLIKQEKRIKEEMFIWGGIVQPSVGFIFGLSKTGKTTFSESLALALATGKESFLGYKIPSAKRVLFISLEEFVELRSSRFEKQLKNLSKPEISSITKNLIISDRDFPGYLAENKDFELLKEYIRQNKSDIVIIDSLSHVLPGTAIEDSSHATTLMKRFRDISIELNVAIILIHHSIKAISEGTPLSIGAMAGSRVLSQEAEFIYGINSTPRKRRYLKQVAIRYAEIEEKVIIFEFNESSLVEMVGKEYEGNLLLDFDGRSDRTNYNLIYDFIQEKSEVSTSELMLKFVDSGIMTKRALYDNLDKLEQDGKITKPTKALFRNAA